MVLGRSIYEGFTTAALLKQQFRNRDPVWQQILNRERYGQCDAEDLTIIKSTILDPERDKDLLTADNSP